MTSIAARLSPSAVNISVQGVRKLSTSAQASNPDADGSKGSAQDRATREYLRRFQQRFGELPPQLNMPVRGEGSDFIVRADGIIMTNAHVVADADGMPWLTWHGTARHGRLNPIDRSSATPT